MNFQKLPESSGVYLFKDGSGKVLYVGKAINIKKRIANHFNSNESDPKEVALISKTASVQTIRVDSEIESLILEAGLIKKHRPFYNTLLKDDKDFLYIIITKDAFPKVLSARKRDLKKAGKYFGPFPSSSKVRTTLRYVRKIFPYSNCKPNGKRPCLRYHLGLCPGVCAGLISPKDYRENIKKITLLLQGEKSKVINILETEKERAVKGLEFESAAGYQSKIDALHYITQPIRVVEFLDENSEDLKKKAIRDLAIKLKLKKRPRRIECYDISNFQGKDATGSMVVFTDGWANRGEYRKFRIRTVKGINDVAMLSEVLQRRFQNDWEKPDLIVIDGGRGQLTAASGVVARMGKRVLVISLAKRREEIYVEGEKQPLRLDRSEPALRLVQRIRDEAHRFAISYHRQLRRGNILTTP